MGSPDSVTLNLSNADEAVLLGLMAMQASEPEQARAAWGELFVRHRRYLFVVVWRAYGRYLGEDGCADLVCDTFRRAFEWTGRHKDVSELTDRFVAESADGTRRRVLGWLGAIAERLFKDRFREDAAREEDFALFLEHWRSASDQPVEPGPIPLSDAVRAALAALSPADAEALRVSLPWYDLATGAFAVPRGEAPRLAEMLGTTPEALRQRRHRAIKRLTDLLGRLGLELPRLRES